MNLGQWGEEQACAYLEEQGFQIVKRNFRCRTGELDIVAKKDETLCFVEVKSRKNTLSGWPGEAVTTQKQRRIRSAAAFYLYQNPTETEDVLHLRMDVVEVLRCGRRTYIRHIKDAFQ